MWERFSPEMKGLVSRARQEALARGSGCVGSEHFLLALCQEPEGTACGVLRELGVDVDSLALKAAAACPQGPARGSYESMGFSPDGKEAIRLAAEEANRLGDGHVRPDHMVLGLIEEGQGTAAKILGEMGVNVVRVRAAVSGASGDEGT